MSPRRTGPRDRQADVAMVAVLAVLAIAARLPFRSDFLVNWDAVNFALGVNGFDLATHQPHPPGYVGWVALSRATNAITSDPNAAMTLLSAISGAAATAVVYLLARRWTGRVAATGTALLFATAPLLWYYSVVALSYMTTGAVALALLYGLLRALEDRSRRALLWSGLALAAIGSLRPTDQALLGLAWLSVVWTFGWRTRLQAIVTTGLATAAWLVPLLWLSGGVGAFRDQSSAVAGLAGGRTWIFGGNLAGIGQNVGMVAAGLVLGLFGGLVVLVVARLRGIRPYTGLPRAQRRLLAAWVAPALFVYLGLHTGQLGYVLLLLPAVYVGVARALEPLTQQVEEVAARAPAPRRLSLGRRLGFAAVTLLALNALAFVVLPSAGQRLVAAAAAPPTDDAQATSPPAAVHRTRQYDLSANDEHWEALTDLIEGHNPATAAVLAETTSAGSFRHLSYYAPDHHVYGVGWDRRGDLGYLFHARDRTTTYSVERLDDALQRLVLADTVRKLIVTDGALIERLDLGDAVSSRLVELDNGAVVAIVQLNERSVVEFTNDPGSGESAAGFPSSDAVDGDTQSQLSFRSAVGTLGARPQAPQGRG